MKVLIATDVHLGHRFNDPIRKNDSFQAFEQVLSIASKNQVDFVLLGGDLYDVRNPNKQILSKSFQIINKYIYGQTQSLQTTLSISNYQPQPNYQYRSIKIPIFSIHGNHDYPDDNQNLLSIYDLVEKAGLIKYFGKHLKTGTNIIKPILFQKTNQKGEKIKLALYGVGYIKDCVLNQMHQKGLIIFEPVEEKEDTFCLFIHHQNRCPGKKYSPNNNFVNPKYIPEWMDLTIWGHYHQPKTIIQNLQGRLIYQPGSTIITSFIKEETYVKQAPLIVVYPNKVTELKSYPLTQSYRPMKVTVYKMSQQIHRLKIQYPNQKYNQIIKRIYQILLSKARQMISQVYLEKHESQKKPIIRIRIDYHSQKIPNICDLEQQLKQDVANPFNVFKLTKIKQTNVETMKQKEGIQQLDLNFNDALNLNQKLQINQQIAIKQDLLITQNKSSKSVSFINTIIQETKKITKSMMQEKKQSNPQNIFEFSVYSHQLFEKNLLEELSLYNNQQKFGFNSFQISLNEERSKKLGKIKQIINQQTVKINNKFNQNIEKHKQYAVMLKDSDQANQICNQKCKAIKQQLKNAGECNLQYKRLRQDIATRINDYCSKQKQTNQIEKRLFSCQMQDKYDMENEENTISQLKANGISSQGWRSFQQAQIPISNKYNNQGSDNLPSVKSKNLIEIQDFCFQILREDKQSQNVNDRSISIKRPNQTSKKLIDAPRKRMKKK